MNAIGIHVCEGCGRVFETIGDYLNCLDTHDLICYPCSHGGVHGSDPCRHCEQNTGEDEGESYCSQCDAR